MRRLALPIGLLAGVLAVAGAFVPVLAAVGGALGIVVLLVQHYFGGPVVIAISADDWKRDGDGWKLVIPRSRHGRRHPSATVWRNLDGKGWGEIIARPYADEEGNLTTRLDDGHSQPFDCQIRVS